MPSNSAKIRNANKASNAKPGNAKSNTGNQPIRRPKRRGPGDDPRNPVLDKASPQDGFKVGHQNRAIGFAQEAVVEVLRRWVLEKHGIERPKDLAIKIIGPMGTISSSAISQVLTGRARLPLRHLGAWTSAFARNQREREALRTLFALASTHGAVLDLFDWKQTVERLEGVLCGR